MARRLMVVVAGVISALALMRPALADEPLTIDGSEILKHRTVETPLHFTSDSAEVPFGEGVSLDLVIDETGRVTEAKPAHGDEEYYEEAERLALGLGFQPFERGGQAVAVKGPMFIPIYPRTRPAADRPFPRATPAETEITLERTACFGTCPTYRITLRGDGLVTYDGGFNVAFGGRVEEHVDPAAAGALIEQFRAAQFFGLDDRYAANVTDLPSTILGLRLGKARKSVTDYAGLYDGMPAAVLDLQQAVEGLARSRRWVSGGPEIVDDLAAARWDFAAPAAAEALACSIRKGAGPLIGALLARGVGPAGYCRGVLALVLAAQSGDIDVVSRLLAAGAMDGDTSDSRQKAVIAAVRSGRPAILAAILRHGGDANAREPDGDSAITIARGQLAEIARWQAMGIDGGNKNDLQSILALLETAGANP